MAANVRRGLFSLMITGLLAAGCSQEAHPSPTSPETAIPREIQTGMAISASPEIKPSETPVPVGITKPVPTSLTNSTQTIPTITPVNPTSTAGSSSVKSFPDASQFTWQPVVDGLASPVGLANAGDGSGRLFVLERAGRIRLIDGGQLVDRAYLDITDRVGSRGSEQGLLGLAFHPKFRENGFFYVNYTDTNGNTVIARFQAEPTANQCDNTTQYILLSVHQPYQNHNGGGMLFGVDGDLYLGLGDGGSAGDPQGNGQSLDTLLGKILRIDVNGTPPYGIPVDNPFIGKGKPEIWAYGLRNPWRFDFDPLTHDLYIGDVGQDAWEEIDFLPAGSRGGANFGWNYQEGKHAYRGNPPANQQLIDPVYEYSHAEGGCSVTGGVVYRGQALPAWQGIYVFGDYCSGKVWGLLRDASGNWQGKVLFDTNYAITSFGRDEGGEIYLVDQRGTIERLAANAS